MTRSPRRGLRRSIALAGLTLLTLGLLGLSSSRAAAANYPKQHGQLGKGVPAFWVRPGYKVTIAVSPGHLTNARFLAFGPDGTLYVSEKSQNKIVAFHKKNDQGVYEQKKTFITNQHHVHDMQWHDGWLWFTTPQSVSKARDTDGDGKADNVKQILKIPHISAGHDWRTLLITDDGHFFTSVGDPSNISDASDTDREKVWRYNLDGSGKTLWASGIRNIEELLFRPGTHELWGVDNGSDWFGKPLGEKRGNQPVTNLNPPGEFDHLIKGGFYGHPFIDANHLPRYEYMDKSDILDIAAKTIPPAWNFGAHWAGLGWTFIKPDNDVFPEDQRGDAIVAFHGSWNRHPRAGYRVQRVLFDDLTGKPYGSLMIVGTLGGPKGEKPLARPVDCITAPDGSILFSSDSPDNAVYRLTWVGDKQ